MCIEFWDQGSQQFHDVKFPDFSRFSLTKILKFPDILIDQKRFRNQLKYTLDPETQKHACSVAIGPAMSFVSQLTPKN